MIDKGLFSFLKGFWLQKYTFSKENTVVALGFIRRLGHMI